MINSKLLILFIPVLLAGCAVTGPADDGYERDNEWVDNGRLLSNETKTIFSTEKKQVSSKIRQVETEAGNNDADFVAYQQWLQAKDKNSEEYEKFQKWKEFEEFQRWKAEQKSQ